MFLLSEYSVAGPVRDRTIPVMSSRRSTPADLDALADVVTRLRRALRRVVRSDVPFEALPMAQIEVMQLLAERPGLRAGEVGEALLLASTTVSTLIGALLTQDLIERQADPADRRAWRLLLTEDGETRLAVRAEITNTPWKQRHAYVLPDEDAQVHGRALHWSFAKRFHVSPFMPMDCTYDWRFTVPGEDLRVHMNVMREGRRTFDATLNLQRLPLTGASLARVLWRYPLMTAQVVGAIHWQALRLWLKRNPVHDHPAPPARPAD